MQISKNPQLQSNPAFKMNISYQCSTRNALLKDFMAYSAKQPGTFKCEGDKLKFFKSYLKDIKNTFAQITGGNKNGNLSLEIPYTGIDPLGRVRETDKFILNYKMQSGKNVNSDEFSVSDILKSIKNESSCKEGIIKFVLEKIKKSIIEKSGLRSFEQDALIQQFDGFLAKKPKKSCIK